jgi:hypothetical protein
MASSRTQRYIAILLLISPWIYVPLVYKEIAFVVLAVLLFLSTIDLRKKKQVPLIDTRFESVETANAALA